MANVNETMIQGTKVVSGDVVSFNTPREVNIKSLKVYFSPKQAGEGTPSPDNVRPISGWTGVEIEHCGKNLFDYANAGIVNNHYRNDNGVETASSSGTFYTSTYYKVKPSTSYSISGLKNNTSYGVRIYRLNKNKEWITRQGTWVLNANYGNIYFLTEDNCYYVQFQFSAGVDISGMQLEESQHETSYEPYKTKILLPNEYQEVEYLESTGTQYIITNYHPQTDWTAVDWKFAFTASQNGDQMLWGARSATNGRKVWQCEKYFGRSWYVACGSVSYRIVLADYGRKLNQIYTGHVDNTTLTVDGGSASPTQTNTGENESTMGIFCWNKNGTAEYKNNGLQIYSLTFKENDIVSANFIPCYRKSDKVAGMYDTVSNTFYTNSGTGEFITGPEVNPHSIDWTSDAGTVYGGYVDLVSGELVETYEMIDLSTITWRKDYYSYGFFSYLPSRFIGVTKNVQTFDGYCDSLNVTNYNKPTTTDYYITMRVSGGNGWIVKTDGTQDVEPTGNLCMALKNPITHQLSPATLTSLVQTNTFWSNADRVEVEYEFVNKFNAIESRKSIFTNTPRTESLSGNILSFNTDMAADLKECKVYFSPKQDLHGYSKPWIGGMGKNLLDVSQFKDGYYIDNDGNEQANALFGYTTSYTPVIAGQTYTLSGNVGNSGNAYSAIYYYNENKEFISRETFFSNTLPHTFIAVEDAKYVNIQYYAAGNLDTVQLESGSSATSYEPYSNVCPIEGWDGIEVTRCGKNLCPPISEWSPGYINGSSGNIVQPGNTLKEKYSDYI